MQRLSPEIQQSFERIQKLAACREDYIKKKGQSLSLKYLCKQFGIYASTVKRLAPELVEKWTDLDFHWHLPNE